MDEKEIDAEREERERDPHQVKFRGLVVSFFFAGVGHGAAASSVLLLLSSSLSFLPGVGSSSCLLLLLLLSF